MPRGFLYDKAPWLRQIPAPMHVRKAKRGGLPTGSPVRVAWLRQIRGQCMFADCEAPAARGITLPTAFQGKERTELLSFRFWLWRVLITERQLEMTIDYIFLQIFFLSFLNLEFRDLIRPVKSICISLMT